MSNLWILFKTLAEGFVRQLFGVTLPPMVSALVCWAYICVQVPIFGTFLPTLFYYFCGPLLNRFKVDLKDWGLTHSLVTKSLINMAIANLVSQPIGLFIGTKLLLRYDYISTSDEIPSLGHYIACLALFVIVNDIFSYLFHRALHEIPGAYKYHKQHHEFKECVASSAQYVGPMESAIVFMPVLIAFFFCTWAFGTLHITELGFSLWYLSCEAVSSHSGFVILPISPFVQQWGGRGNGTDFHYFHHTHQIGNYGQPYVDWLFGSDIAYREFVAKSKTK